MRPLRLMALLAAMLLPGPALAQLEPRTCGVLDGPGCNPNQCGVLDGPGCLAQPPALAGEGLQLTVGLRAASGAKKPDGELNTIRDLFAALRACWTPPPAQSGYPGMQMSLRFSFNRAGGLIGEPRVTFASREASEDTRDLYREALTRSLQACMPLPIARGFGGVIAGRRISVRLIDDRDDVARVKPKT